MTSDIDIYRSANLLIQQHGEDAPVHAAMRADELMEAGDMEGRAVWKMILKAIEELLSKERPGDAEVLAAPAPSLSPRSYRAPDADPSGARHSGGGRASHDPFKRTLRDPGFYTRYDSSDRASSASFGA